MIHAITNFNIKRKKEQIKKRTDNILWKRENTFLLRPFLSVYIMLYILAYV